MGICFSLDQRASSTFHTSCLWRLREIRWWRIRWRSRALAVLVLLSSRFVSFRRQGTLFCGRGWRSTSIAKFIFECLFLFDLFAFLCLVALPLLFRFLETPSGEFSVPTSSWSLLDAMRKGLLISFPKCTCFPCQSSVVSVALYSANDEWNINEYQYDKYFQCLPCNALLSWQRKRKEDCALT